MRRQLGKHYRLPFTKRSGNNTLCLAGLENPVWIWDLVQLASHGSGGAKSTAQRRSGEGSCVSDVTLAAHVTADKPQREMQRLLDSSLIKSVCCSCDSGFCVGPGSLLGNQPDLHLGLQFWSKSCLSELLENSLATASSQIYSSACPGHGEGLSLPHFAGSPLSCHLSLASPPRLPFLRHHFSFPEGPLPPTAGLLLLSPTQRHV